MDVLTFKLKKVFLNDFHKNLNAKFISFAGYSMPINYEHGMIKEHLQVRKSVGIFDVSHMGQILILLTESNINKLESYIPLNLKNININKSYYSFILNAQGGIIDDIILSKIIYNKEEYFFIVYNASRKEINEKIFKENLSKYIFLKDNSLIAIQGPISEEIISFLPKVNNLYFMNTLVITYLGHSVIISRSGYTGEDGFELSIPNLIVKDFIMQIMKNKNAKFCGLGSRDSLRLEAGLSLYGNELNDVTTPIEANLNWALNKQRLNDKTLNGSKILLDQIKNGTNKYQIALKSLSKSILRKDMKLFDQKNNEIGHITSGAYSPILNFSIGIGYLFKKLDFNEKIYTLIRGNIEELKIDKLPFVLHKYKKG